MIDFLPKNHHDVYRKKPFCLANHFSLLESRNEHVPDVQNHTEMDEITIFSHEKVRDFAIRESETPRNHSHDAANQRNLPSRIIISIENGCWSKVEAATCIPNQEFHVEVSGFS